MLSLIIGAGEVGTALFETLRDKYEVYLFDKGFDSIGRVGVLHICFPYSKDFNKEVKRYLKLVRPKYAIIHSTVPVGTSRSLNCYHSPIRGMHPDIVKGLKTFPKYLAPKNNFLKRYFDKVGIKIVEAAKPETTEYLKIMDTTQYGLNIIIEKIMHRYCLENGLDFEIAYTHANKTYNEGYRKLGKSNVQRPVLKHVDGKIGGHCIINNCDLLDSPLTKFLKKQNK